MTQGRGTGREKPARPALPLPRPPSPTAQLARAPLHAISFTGRKGMGPSILPLAVQLSSWAILLAVGSWSPQRPGWCSTAYKAHCLGCCTDEASGAQRHRVTHPRSHSRFLTGPGRSWASALCLSHQHRQPEGRVLWASAWTSQSHSGDVIPFSGGRTGCGEPSPGVSPAKPRTGHRCSIQWSSHPGLPQSAFTDSV